jgi:hypothetical protein
MKAELNRRPLGLDQPLEFRQLRLLLLLLLLWRQEVVVVVVQ